MRKDDGRQKYYIIDLKKVREFMRSHNYTNGGLSEALGYNRRWLNQVFNRKKRSGGVRIDIEAAQKMADLFCCGIQDIGVEANQECNPVIFDYEAEARTRFNRLLAKQPKQLAELMRFLETKGEEKNISAIDDLMLYISDRGQMHLNGPEVGNEWIKMLYVSTFAHELAGRLNDCWEEQDIVDKYQAKKKREIKLDFIAKDDTEDKKDAEGKKDKIYVRMEKEIQIMTEVMQSTFQKAVNALFDDDNLEKDASKKCAVFLHKYFESRVTDPSTELQVKQYKRGLLF